MALRCKESFSTVIGKGKRAEKRLVGMGELVRDNDPVVRGREHLFTDTDDFVETAAAFPGHKREAKPPQPEEVTKAKGDEKPES